MRGSRSKDCNVDLGLAILKRRIEWMIENNYPPDLIAQFRTFEAMAYYCGCSRENIRLVYKKGLRKLRIALQFRDVESWLQLREILETIDTRDRQPAIKNGQNYRQRATAIR